MTNKVAVFTCETNESILSGVYDIDDMTFEGYINRNDMPPALCHYKDCNVVLENRYDEYCLKHSTNCDKCNKRCFYTWVNNLKVIHLCEEHYEEKKDEIKSHIKKNIDRQNDIIREKQLQREQFLKNQQSLCDDVNDEDTGSWFVNKTYNIINYFMPPW